MLSAAVALQNACEGVVMGAPLRLAGVSPLRGLLIVLLTGSAVPLGALVGHLVSTAAVAALPFVLALAAGPSSTSPRTRSSPSPTATARGHRLGRRGGRVPGHDADRRRPAVHARGRRDTRL
jgi:hypothetical protein